MDEKIQAILQAATKKGYKPIDWIILATLLANDGRLDFDSIKLLTGVAHNDRVSKSLRRLMDAQQVKIDRLSMYYVQGLYNINKTNNTTTTTKYRDSVSEPPTVIPVPGKSPTFQLYKHLVDATGRPSRNPMMDMSALKNMLKKAHLKVRDEDNQMIQAVGVVKDYITYKVDDWIRANANQPAMLLQKQFEAYLSVLPSKPRHERRDELQVYGKRVGWDMKARQWVVTDDKLPN